MTKISQGFQRLCFGATTVWLSSRSLRWKFVRLFVCLFFWTCGSCAVGCILCRDFNESVKLMVLALVSVCASDAKALVFIYIPRAQVKCGCSCSCVVLLSRCSIEVSGPYNVYLLQVSSAPISNGG